MLNKAFASSILIVIFGGISTAIWGAIVDITELKTKSVSLDSRIERIEYRNEKSLERIEKKLEEIRGLL